jgi:hypothetical protein
MTHSCELLPMCPDRTHESPPISVQKTERLSAILCSIGGSDSKWTKNNVGANSAHGVSRATNGSRHFPFLNDACWKLPFRWCSFKVRETALDRIEPL